MVDGRPGILGMLVQLHVDLDNKVGNVTVPVLHQQMVVRFAKEKKMITTRVQILHVQVIRLYSM